MRAIERESGWIGLLGVALVASLLGSSSGCATSSPASQEFVEVTTDRFVVTSSLSEKETEAFARSLELFHGGVRALMALYDEKPRPARTQVLVFDDRTLRRPFAVMHKTAYVVDAVDAPVLVFRGARDFAARATPEFRHAWARRIERDNARVERPLWCEEGVARLADSILETDDGLVIGRVRGPYRQGVLRWKSSELQATLQQGDLSDASDPERELFAARTWAIAHTLEFSKRAGVDQPSMLALYQTALQSSDPATRDHAYARTIGLTPDELAKRVYKNLDRSRMPARRLDARAFTRWERSSRAVSRVESRSRLGELALAIGKPKLARSYFEKALRLDGNDPRAKLGLANALARLGEGKAARKTLSSLRPESVASPALSLAAAEAERAIAESSPASPERRTALASARRLYAAAATGKERAASALYGSALTFLVDGEDPEEAVHALDAAREASGGSLALELAYARAEAKAGRTRAASVRVRNVVTRAQDDLLREAARAFLATLNES